MRQIPARARSLSLCRCATSPNSVCTGPGQSVGHADPAAAQFAAQRFGETGDVSFTRGVDRKIRDRQKLARRTYVQNRTRFCAIIAGRKPRVSGVSATMFTAASSVKFLRDSRSRNRRDRRSPALLISKSIAIFSRSTPVDQLVDFSLLRKISRRISTCRFGCASSIRRAILPADPRAARRATSVAARLGQLSRKFAADPGGSTGNQRVQPCDPSRTFFQQRLENVRQTFSATILMTGRGRMNVIGLIQIAMPPTPSSRNGISVA